MLGAHLLHAGMNKATRLLQEVAGLRLLTDKPLPARKKFTSAR
jgi:hypothetical protein